MPGRVLLKSQIFKMTTQDPIMRNMDHLKIVPRHWTRRVTFNDPTVKAVPMRDRIKYWNIVPGDKVCIFGDKNNTIHEVMSVNKITNQVFMKDATTVRVILLWTSDIIILTLNTGTWQCN